VSRYSAHLYQLSAMTKVWENVERKFMQHKDDTEKKVQADFDSGIGLLKGELRMVRGNLNNNCQVDAATHGNTLQHTATHCNTLRHIATLYSTL